jgi:hypothetical protein
MGPVQNAGVERMTKQGDIYGLKIRKKLYGSRLLAQLQKTPNVGYLKNRLLQFKIELNDITPLIWRRIQVPSEYNFWDLHVAIQDAMGWLDYHLHHFEIKGKVKRSKKISGFRILTGSTIRWKSIRAGKFPF